MPAEAGPAAGRPRVAVIGGGVSGLAAAYFLARSAARQGLALDCHLFEAEPRLGGKVQTLRLPAPAGPRPAEPGASGEGEPILLEQGPDALYAFKPRAIRLAEELGLGDRMVSARPGLPTYVLRRGQLRALPDGLWGLVPTRIGAFARSDLLSLTGKLRMGLDFFIPPRPDGRDESVGEFVARRLGREAVQALADPLLAAIHGADPWKLSVLATYPHLREQERRYGGLVRAALAGRRAPRAAGSPFRTLRGGLAELVQALEAAVAGRIAVHRGARVRRLGRSDGSYVVEADGAGGASFDAVILTVPAGEAARLVLPWAPRLAGELSAIEYTPATVVALVYGPGRVPEASPVRQGSGVLVPAAEGRRAGLTVSACSWYSTKWPHTSPGGQTVVRCFVGRDGDGGAAELDDRRLVDAVRADLLRLVALQAVPDEVRVFRWPQGLPQYRVGHLDRVRRIEEAAAGVGGLFITGAALRGMGISDCVTQAERAAERCLNWLGDGSVRPGR